MSDELAKITITHERMEEVDALYPSPTENAELVFQLLMKDHPELTNWQLVCFSAMYIGLVGDQYPWIKMPAMAINRLLHILHYKYPEKTNAGMGHVDETLHEDRESKRQGNSSSDVEKTHTSVKTLKRSGGRRKKSRKHRKSGNRVPDRRGQSGLSEGNLTKQENARRTQQRITHPDRDEKTS